VPSRAVNAEPAVSPDDSQRRAALLLFAIIEVVAFAYWMVLARHEWFFDDEWDFIAARRAGSLHDLFYSHYGHWSTVPILAYRALWTVFGLHSYLPYLATVVLAHLACAALLRVVMRRAAVGPWIATAAAALFAFFGAGYQDIVWAFQIGFDFALGFGIVALLLADRDGPLSRRDIWGLAAGVFALASSGVGVAMAVVVALAVLVRRGWKVAAAYTVVLASIYVVWWIVISNKGTTTASPALTDLGRFVLDGVTGALDLMGQVPGLGWLLGLLALVGVVVAFADAGVEGTRTRAAPLAMAVGAPVFLVFSGYQRVSNLGAGYAHASRYQHVVVALLLPTIAIAFSAFGSRLRLATPLLALLLLIGIPGNIGTLHDYTRRQQTLFRVTRETVVALPRAPLANEVPSDVRPLPENADTARVTIGWLRSAVRAGKIPTGGTAGVRLGDEITFRLSILQSNEPDETSTKCRLLTRAETRNLRRGEMLVFRNAALKVSTTVRPDTPPVSLTYSTYSGNDLTVVGAPQLRLVLTPASFFAPTVCSEGVTQSPKPR